MVLFPGTAVSGFTPQQTHFEWADEFRYTSLAGFQNAGWSILGSSDLISFPGNGIQMDNDGSRGVTVLRSGFPTSIYDWKAGAQGYWVGREYGSIQIGVNTTLHQYIWGGDGFYPEFVLYRDGVKVLRFGGYAPQENVPVSLIIEKKGNTLLLYSAGKVMNTYLEVDPSGELASLYLFSGWVSTIRYDYVDVSGISERVSQATGGITANQQLVTSTVSAMGATSIIVEVAAQSDLWAKLGSIAGIISAIGTTAVVVDIYLHRRKKSKKAPSKGKPGK